MLFDWVVVVLGWCWLWFCCCVFDINENGLCIVVWVVVLFIVSRWWCIGWVRWCWWSVSIMWCFWRWSGDWVWSGCGLFVLVLLWVLCCWGICGSCGSWLVGRMLNCICLSLVLGLVCCMCGSIWSFVGIGSRYWIWVLWLVMWLFFCDDCYVVCGVRLLVLCLKIVGMWCLVLGLVMGLLFWSDWWVWWGFCLVIWWRSLVRLVCSWGCWVGVVWFYVYRIVCWRMCWRILFLRRWISLCFSGMICWCFCCNDCFLIW